MGQIRALRALNFGDVLDQTIALIRGNFRLWLKISAVAYVPIVVLQMIQLALLGPSMFDLASLAQGDAFADYTPSIMFWLVSSLILGIASAFAFLLLSAALTYGIAQRFLGNTITAGSSYRVALASLWRLLLCSIVALVMLTLIMLAGAVPIGLAALIGLPEWSIVLIGLIAFLAILVVSTIFGVRWSVALPAVVLERAGPLRALTRSSELLKGLWWRTLGLLVLTTIGLYLVISFPSTVISMVTMFAVMAVRPDLTYLAMIVTTAVGALFTIVSAPLFPCVLTLVYYDARIRKEGFDLQVLAERHGQGRPPAVDGQP